MEGPGATAGNVMQGLFKRRGTVLAQPDTHMQNNEGGPLPYTRHRNELKMDQTPKCRAKHKGENYESQERTGVRLGDRALGKAF